MKECKGKSESVLACPYTHDYTLEIHAHFLKIAGREYAWED
jgi:hypothetical protein